MGPVCAHRGIELRAGQPPDLGAAASAHGYVTLEPETEVVYKVTDHYAPECDRGIAWDEPALGTDWRLDAKELILSEKDRRRPRVSDAAAAFAWTGRSEASAGGVA